MIKYKLQTSEAKFEMKYDFWSIFVYFLIIITKRDSRILTKFSHQPDTGYSVCVECGVWSTEYFLHTVGVISDGKEQGTEND